MAKRELNTDSFERIKTNKLKRKTVKRAKPVTLEPLEAKILRDWLLRKENTMNPLRASRR